MTTKLSIVILNYNGEKFLDKTIPVALKLNYPDLEIIISDNGSNDKSIEYLNQINDPRLKVIFNGTNIGYGAGKNIGVEAASGEYVLLLDNDILIDSHLNVSELINFIEQNNAGLIQPILVDVAKTETKFYGHEANSFDFKQNRPYVSVDKIKNYVDNFYEVAAVTGGCFFFKKETWQQLGGFDTQYPFNIDDIDISPRFYVNGYKNYIYTRSFFTHLGIENKSKNSGTSINYVRRMRYAFAGHARALVKNYRLGNIITRLPLLWLFYFLKSISQTFSYRDFNVLIEFLRSCAYFWNDLPDTFAHRIYIQRARKIEYDDFLKLKLPTFS